MTADVNVVIDHSEYTILVVDDVVSNVLLLKVLLTNEKFKVVTANNGKDALVQAAEKQPDLILLDVMMPEMNGFEVSEKLKANPVTQNIPIIFLTALNTTSDIVKGFKVGANDFISKPFNKEELVIRVTIIRKSKFPQNPKRSVRFSGKRTKRSVQKRKARNTQKAETKVL